MKPSKVKGAPIPLTCRGCGVDGYGGDETYRSASGATTIRPQDWYLIDLNVFCAPCTARIVEYEDPTRSKTVFFGDVKGESWAR